MSVNYEKENLFKRAIKLETEMVGLASISGKGLKMSDVQKRKFARFSIELQDSVKIMMENGWYEDWKLIGQG